MNPILSTIRPVPLAALCCILFFAPKAQPQATNRSSLPPDSLLPIGYSAKMPERLSGMIEPITERGMNNIQITNPIEAISGRVAGLAVQRGNNGQATLEAVRLRGTTSLIAGNDPLIIVDGVFGDLNMLNSVYPTDIESFTILKDASETAQYGSRGASGVIQITTKKGMSGKTLISYSGSYGITSAYKRLPMLTGDEFRATAVQRGTSIIDKGFSTNFQKEIEQTGWQQNHHVAFNGGSDEANYRIALGYIDRQGVLKGEHMKNFFSNMNISQKVLPNLLSAQLGMFASIRKNSIIPDFQKMFYSAAAFNPTFPNRPDSETGAWNQIPTASQITNPLAWLEVDDDQANTHISTHARLEFTPNKYLTVSAFGSYSHSIAENAQFLPTTVWAHGQAYRATRKTENLLGNISLNYKNAFDKHVIDALALAEVQQETNAGYWVTATDFSSNAMGYHNLQAGATRLWEGTASFYEQPKLASFMARVSYTYANRYTLTANARADASSKFGANRKWGVFPSVSAAWNAGNEPFIRDIEAIGNLKFRIGYGLTGNQSGIDSYTALQLLSPSGIAPVGSAPSATFSTLRNANPDLKWEVKRTFDAGLDMELLNDRLYVSAGYYRSKTLDMLYVYNVPVPPFVFNTLLANIGSMQNSGTEIAVGAIPFRNADMELSVNLNATFQQNKLLSLSGEYRGETLSAPEYRSIASLNGAGFHGGYNHVVYQIVGQPLGVFYLPKSSGLVSDGSGGYTYGIEDLNGGGISLEDGEDRYVAGQAMPKALIGSNIGFRYRQFDVSVQINGAFGHKIYNGTALTYMNINSFPDYNVMRDAPQRNIKDQTATDYWLEGGDYVNVDYVALGWNVPVGSGRRITSLRLSAVVSNLATITRYSGLTPMINHSAVSPTLGLDDKRGYPPARTYSVGLSVSF